jgi:hypothetical protein
LDLEEITAMGQRQVATSGVPLDFAQDVGRGGFELEEVQEAFGQTQSREASCVSGAFSWAF